MKFTVASFLTAFLAGQAAAATIGHAHGLTPKHHHAVRHSESRRAATVEQSKRTESLEIDERGLIGSLLSFGLSALGINPTAKSSSTPWLGADGDFTNKFFNNGTDDLYLVIWGVAGSWVNVIQPHITVAIPAGQDTTVSFPFGSTGAWAALYPDTKLVNGQISETWGEFTFNEWSTVDVSREVNMNGRTMRIVTPQCTTDMETCVFVCPNGQTTCMTGYELLNCTPGSQPGANYGTYFGAPSGGCSGMGSAAHLETHFDY